MGGCIFLYNKKCEGLQSSIELLFTADIPRGVFCEWSKAEFTENPSLIIDEFPFMACPNPSIKSILQHEIDHHWKDQNLFLILCGSSVSFMVNDIMGYESPLYGRTTSSMEVLPFDYIDGAEFFPDYTKEEKLMACGILGGIPRYLQAFSPLDSGYGF